MVNVPINSPWAQSLQPASYNQIPFVTDGTTYTTGRRVAVHSYPFRDNPWVEDLGLATRSVQFSGFLVGDDVFSQRDQLKTACEQSGNGTLVHPSMGTLTAALVSASFGETAEKGRTVAVQFQFIVTDDKPRWPTTDVSTPDATQLSAVSTNFAASGDFFNQVGAAVQQGTSAIGALVNSAQYFMRNVTGAVLDASSIVSSVSGGLGLQGFGAGSVLGRFTSGIGAANSVLSGISGISARLTNLGGFISSGLSGVVQGGITGLSSLPQPGYTVIGGNLGTIDNLSAFGSVISSNVANANNFVTANTSQFTGLISQGIGVEQQMAQQIGSVINQTTAVRGLLANAAIATNNLASGL